MCTTVLCYRTSAHVSPKQLALGVWSAERSMCMLRISFYIQRWSWTWFDLACHRESGSWVSSNQQNDWREAEQPWFPLLAPAHVKPWFGLVWRANQITFLPFSVLCLPRLLQSPQNARVNIKKYTGVNMIYQQTVYNGQPGSPQAS